MNEVFDKVIGLCYTGNNYGKLVKTLDKEEFRIKLEEINKLVQNKDYKGAMNIVDSIDWRRVKNVRTLCVVGEIYAANGRYEDSKEIFLLAYHKASIGKNILYRLVEISLKMKNVDEATEFYEEYKQVAPNDSSQYILQYKIARVKNISLDEQIKILEEYKEHEFTEKWSYELAALYYKAGEKEKSLELCNEIILWFSEGKYVMKAYDLKQRMGELTGEEKAKYEKQFVPKLIKPEEAGNIKKAEQDRPEDSEEEKDLEKETSEKSTEEEEQPEIIRIEKNSRENDGAESIQDKISKGIRDIFGGARKKADEELNEEKESSEEVTETEEDQIPEEIIKTDSTEKEPENVPELEAEPAKPGESPVINKQPESQKVNENQEEKEDFGKTMKLPELKIPDSMKNMEPSSAPKIEDIQKVDFAEMEKSGKEFNLEDTILAAASAQGIEIPKEEPLKEESTKEEKPEEKEREDKKLSDDLEKPDFLTSDSFGDHIEVKAGDLKVPNIMPFEEEDDVTEEDLKSAEEEFLHGPAGKKDLNADYNLEDMDAPADQDEETINVLQNPEDNEDLSEEEELERFIESIQPKDEKDPRDIIPREKILNDDEKQLFTYFVKIPGMREQLLNTLCDVQQAAADKTSRTGNIIVMGGKECGKTRLISGLIPAICKELNLEASKVAYVFADQINGKPIDQIFEKLSGGFLVIENANQLTQETVEMLDKAMEKETDGLTVIIEDEKIGMRKFIARYPKIVKKFTSMINIPVFTNDELVNFARVYTKENGYTIDQMGMLALYNLIGINQKEDQPMNIGAVKNLIDTAILKSQGGIRKFKRNISKKRIDRDGYIVLYEKDFSK
ncbi:tetratricopeptide repeat protein [Blautia sp. HCP3S3_C12]|uniref:tetratricopeptide repeat protein n=1 Tax=unclassified Blautia TaxID=2648079 RepID=UPI003F8CC490